MKYNRANNEFGLGGKNMSINAKPAKLEAH